MQASDMFQISMCGLNISVFMFNEEVRIIVRHGWKVIVKEQNEILGKLHIPRENFTFPRS